MIPKWRYVWWPIAVLNRLREVVRNHLFDNGIWKSVEFEMPVIYVGSIANEPTIALSKYIQEITQGALHVSRYSLDDYALDKCDTQNYYTALSATSTFCTTHMVLGLSEWYQNHPNTSAIIMDGLYVRDEIRPELRVLLTSFDLPFVEDKTFPVGNLQASKASAREADIVLVYDAKESHDIEKLEKKLRHYLKQRAAVFFIKNSKDSLKTFNSDDKIEFVADRHNFERLILNILPKANPNSE